ncbi:MAG TPA: phosphotransferase, partial [Vicinamibacterales bacterium]
MLKIANAGEDRRMLEAEHATMRHLAATHLVPVPLPARAGDDIARFETHHVRLVTYLEGRLLAETPRQTDALLVDLGRSVGRIDRALATFDHPALHRRFYWDLAQAPSAIERDLPRVPDPRLRRIIESMLAVHQDLVVPRLPSCRQTVIHGDVNDYNVLVDARTDRVTGIVDFGDMVFSHTVNDLAIAMAYAALGKPDPLGAAAAVASGYHAVHPLTEDELAALYGLMTLRLCLSVCIGAVQLAERPDRDYLGISQAPIRATLPTLAAIHPRLAHYRLRDACGLEPVPHTPRVVEWLRANRDLMAPLTGHDLAVTPVLGVDMSAGSPLIASNPDDNAAEPLAHRVAAAMRRAGAALGAGGYDEARVIYRADAFATGALCDERRTIHIGLDLTLPAGSPLYAPLDGTVHGFDDAAARLDYGPVIVLRHEVDGDERLMFYTLYGHLDRRSLDGLHQGKRFKAGERFAAVGAPPDNGDWWPHVHVQVITDLLDVPCNFNGVAPASQRRAWLSLSPDPNLLLGIPPDRFARHPTTATLVDDRRRLFGGNVRLSYGSRPLQIVRGWMQHLFDETGRPYLDAYNNVPHVGHAHPRVTAAVAAQLGTVNINTRYLNEVV